MSSPAFEAFLARLYLDTDVRARFLAGTLGRQEAPAVSAEEWAALQAIDRVGLEMMADSLAAKRERRERP